MFNDQGITSIEYYLLDKSMIKLSNKVKVFSNETLFSPMVFFHTIHIVFSRPQIYFQVHV